MTNTDPGRPSERTLRKLARFRSAQGVLSLYLSFEPSGGERRDVHAILQDSKRYRGPAPKRFVLGLQGIDLNAKLLAHEAKIQYLDLKALNFLMDLFDEPKIVV